MLKLKSETKQLFIDAGLEELTVGRDANGYVALIGKECNQPILSIGSVQVGSKLSKAESEIVINEYLIPTLTTYGKDVRTYIDLKKALKIKDTKLVADSRVLEDTYGVRLNVKSSYPDYSKEVTSVTFKKFDTVEVKVDVMFNDDKEMAFDFDKYVTTDQIKETTTYISKNYFRAQTVIDLHNETLNDEKAIAEAFTKLSKLCSF